MDSPYDALLEPRKSEYDALLEAPKPKEQPSALGQIGRGVGEAIKGLIPKSLGEAARMFLYTPAQEAPHAIKEAYDVLRGVPIEQAVPESQISKQSLQEQAKFFTGSAIGAAVGILGLRAKPSLRETAFGKVKEPLAAEQAATQEVIKNASEIESAKPVSEREVRPRVGEEAPLRPIDQGQAATQESTQEVAGVTTPTAETPTTVGKVTPQGQAELPTQEYLFSISDKLAKQHDEILMGEGGIEVANKFRQEHPLLDYGSANYLELMKIGKAPPEPALPVSEGGEAPAAATLPEQKPSETSEGGVSEKEVEGQGRVLEGEAGAAPAAAQPPTGVPAEQVPFVQGSPQIAGEVPFEQAAASGRISPTGTTEPIRVRPLTALKSVYEASEKAGAAGYKRGLSEARAEGKSAVAQIKGELSVADKWLAGDQEKVRQNMVQFVNASLPPAERGRFIGAITKALRRPPIRGGDPAIMYRHAFNVFKLIEKRADAVYKNGLVSDIKDTLSKSLQSKSVDVEYRRGLQGIMDKISLTKPSEKMLGRLKSLQDFVDKERAAGREPNIPKEHLEQLSTLGKLPLRDMTTNALEQLRDNIENLTSLGKLKANLMERAWTRSRENSIKELRQSPSNPIEARPMYRPQPTERLTVGQKFMNVVRATLNARLNLENAIAPMDEIYDHLDGARGTYDGWASKNIKGRLDLDRNKTVSEWLPIKQQSDALIKKYGLKTSDMETVQSKGIIKMIGRERLEAMGVRPDIIDKIDSKPFTAGQQAYHDFIRQQYDQVGARIQDVAHRLYQQDMQIVPDYMPLERDWAAHAEREPPEPMADPSVGQMPFNETATMNQLLRDVNPKILSRTEQGFLKDRIEGAKTAVKLDANEVFERHIQDALHFVNSQPNLKMLGQIVRRPDFANKFGKTGQNIVLDHLDTIANQGYVNHLQRVRWLDWVRNSTSKGAIGFRVASNFVHTSQLPIAMYHAGGAQWWSKGLELALTEKGQNWLRQNAAETYVRSGGEPAQAEVEAFSKFGRAGFFVARNIDKLNSQATLLGRYVKEMKKAGVPIDQALDAPVNPEIQGLALRRMHRAVASPQAKDIPQMTSRGAFVGGNVSVARAINQFRNIFLDNWSNVRHDIMRVGVNDAEKVIGHLRQGEIAAGARQVGDSASHRVAITAAMLMSVAMETGIKLASKKGIESGMSAITGIEPPKRKEEETYLGDLQHHLINRVPFAGQLYTAAVYGETGIPTIDAILAPIHETGQILKSKTPQTEAKHVVRAASAAGTVLGIPGTSQALEAAQPLLTKAIAPVLPDRSKHRVSRR